MSEPDPFAEPRALAGQLRDKLKMSTGYASDLANGKRVPSLKLAATIEAQLGIPASAWMKRPHQSAAA